MLVDFFFRMVRPVLGILALARDATFHPVRTGKAIELGSREDFNRRIAFFLGMLVLNFAVVALVVTALGFEITPGEFPLGPIVFIAVLFTLLLLPMRAFGWTKLKLAEYFQAVAMSAGPAFFVLPFMLLPLVLVHLEYGQLIYGDPRVQAVINSSYSDDWALCVKSTATGTPLANTPSCFRLFAMEAPETAWASSLASWTSLLALIPTVCLIKAATNISYWKQAVSVVIVLLVVFVGLFIAAVISAFYFPLFQLDH